MKNRIFNLMLTLAAIWPATALAYTFPGDIKTSFADGDRVFISSQYTYNGSTQAPKYLSYGIYTYEGSTYAHPAWTALEREPNEDYAIQLIDAGQEVLGYPGYYIFFEKRDCYFSAYGVENTSSAQGWISCYWSGLANATPVALVPVLADEGLVGAATSGASSDDFYIVCESSDGKPYCLNAYYDDSYAVTVKGGFWGGGSCWFTFTEAVEKEIESYLPLLVDLYNAHLNDVYTLGNDPGCLQDEDVVEEFYEAMDQASPLTVEETGHTEEEYEEAYNRLNEAVAAVSMLTRVPFTPGYYYVRPGLAEYGGRHSGKALQAYNSCIYIVDDANFMLTDEGKTKLIWEFTPAQEGSSYYRMRSIYTNQYVCKGTSYNYQWKILGNDNLESIWMYPKNNGSFCPYLDEGYSTYTYYLIPYVNYNMLYYYWNGNEEGGGATYYFEAVPEEEIDDLLQMALDCRLRNLLEEVEVIYDEADPDFMASLDQTIVNRFAQAIEASKEVESGTTTEEHITELQEAYDAFMGEYNIADKLWDTIDEAEEISNAFAIGDGLGFYPEGTENHLLDLVEQAEEIISSGDFTTHQVSEQIALLRDAINELQSAVNSTPDPSKWYHINFATLDEYYTYGWGQTQGEGLFGTTLSIAENATTPLLPSEVRTGAGLYFSEGGLGAPEMSDFRFLPVGEGTYALQNRGTGLFINTRGKGYGATVSTTPTLFTIIGKGAGKVLLKGYNLMTGESCDLIHAQKSGAKLVGWDSEGIETNSAFRVEAVLDNGGEDLPVIIDVTPGAAQVMTWPFNVTRVEQGTMYKVAGQFIEAGSTYIGLNETYEGVEAGEPFVYIADGDYEQGSLIPETFYAGTSVATKAGTSDCNLTGTFLSRVTVEEPNITLSMNRDGEPQWEVAEGIRIEALSGYIAVGDYTLPTIDPNDCELRILLSDPNHLIDGIADSSAQAKTSACFDLSGRSLDGSSLRKGIYILNRTKVLVK